MKPSSIHRYHTWLKIIGLTSTSLISVHLLRVNLRMRLVFLGILKQARYTLACYIRCRYKRDDFFIGDELSCLSEREFKLHSLPPSRGLEIRNSSRVSLCTEGRVLPNGHWAMLSKLTRRTVDDSPPNLSLLIFSARLFRTKACCKCY